MGGILLNNFNPKVLPFFFSLTQILTHYFSTKFSTSTIFPSTVRFYPGLLKHYVFKAGNYFQLLGKRFLWLGIYLLRHCFDLSDYVSINAGSTSVSLLYLIKGLINISGVL